MANKTDVKDAPTRDEMQISLGSDPDITKVELDLDDAPFLKDEQESASPAVQDGQKLPAQDAPDPQAQKKKKLLVLAAGATILLLLLGAAAWWFFLRTPPPPPLEIKPEIIVVPSQPADVPSADYVKELAPFVIPRKASDMTRFLVCKFSTISKSPRVSGEMDHKMISLRDALFFYLCGKNDDYLLDPNNAVSIKKDLTNILNDYLSSGHIDDILFESYLAE